MKLMFLNSMGAAKRTAGCVVTIVIALCVMPMGATAARMPVRPTAYRKIARHRRVRYRRHRITLPKAPSKDRTEEIQTALGRDGYYNAEPNGKWDARTQEALREFQEASGLAPTGKLDALSLQRMGLGSDVAGVSAPKKSAATNRLTSSGSSTPKGPGR